ncbi:MAG: hypothetical protein WA118_14165 [Carboxydocellales bacterium]
MAKDSLGLKIYAYGFDILGFEIQNTQFDIKGVGEVEFIKFNESEKLERADGVVLPQGIFEQLEKKDAFYGEWVNVKVSTELLLEREREVTNLLKNRKWICFLVAEIVDRVPQGDIKDTDLCKRILNNFSVDRAKIDGNAQVESKTNEFITFIENYGIAKTVFRLPYSSKIEIKVLAKSNKGVVGLDIGNQVFLLPFHTTKRDEETLINALGLVIKSIIDYRQKRVLEAPLWLEEFGFNAEERITQHISSLMKQLEQLRYELEAWNKYKLILTTSGDILKDIVVNILEVYFGFSVDPIDEKREDAKILDNEGQALVMVEVKGTKKGIKREHINQVDSHRERNELTSDTLGILIINNEMSCVSIDQKIATEVPPEQIKHARNMNVLIIRTIDLLMLMKQLETLTNKKEVLLNIFNSGGGWLKASPEGYELYSE